MKSRPHIAHVIFQFGTGGLENGLVNLLNSGYLEEYRHSVVALKDITKFAERLSDKSIELIGLNKREGPGLLLYPKLWRVLRSLKPAMIHTRNLGCLEAARVGRLAGVGVRIHGEHGWNMTDIDGSNDRYLGLRKRTDRIIHKYIAVSREIESWLISKVGVAAEKVSLIENGVDAKEFAPAAKHMPHGMPAAFGHGRIVMGTVGRLDPVKNQSLLISAFAGLLQRCDSHDHKPGLAIIGDGPERSRLEARARELGVEEHVWFAGARDDIPQLLVALDIFVLPSLREGMSNTILEAMACGLPVVATAVGVNSELVKDSVGGQIVPSCDQQALENALLKYVVDETLREQHGSAARATVLQRYTIGRMARSYRDVYRELCPPAGRN